MKKYKIFDYTWHIPHQYDMIYALRDHCQFSLCHNIKRQWDETVRPIPENVEFVSNYQEGLYDLAILHIDQQVLSRDNIKSIIYDEFNSLITDIPKIVLNHGSPVIPELFLHLGYYQMTEKEMEQSCVKIIKELVGNNTMVVNSYTAASNREWGFGHPIVHGMNPNDWYDLPKEPRAFSALSPYGFDRYYNRECMQQVSQILSKTYGHTLGLGKVNVQTGSSPEAYKNFLGRSLLYLDTSYRTPMNRARTEAFLSGCCVIQVEGAHDLERWAKPGENILIVPDAPNEIAEKIADILENHYDQAIAIGQKGKEMAVKEFSPERYCRDWLTLLQTLIHD